MAADDLAGDQEGGQCNDPSEHPKGHGLGFDGPFGLGFGDRGHVLGPHRVPVGDQLAGLVCHLGDIVSAAKAERAERQVGAARRQLTGQRGGEQDLARRKRTEVVLHERAAEHHDADEPDLDGPVCLPVIATFLLRVGVKPEADDRPDVEAQSAGGLGVHDRLVPPVGTGHPTCHDGDAVLGGKLAVGTADQARNCLGGTEVVVKPGHPGYVAVEVLVGRSPLDASEMVNPLDQLGVVPRREAQGRDIVPARNGHI